MSEAKQDALDRANKMFGMVPNLIEEIASHSPAAAQVYLAGNERLAEGNLSAAQQQAVMVAVSTKNDCHYCTAAHRMIGKMSGISMEDLDRMDKLDPPEDESIRGVCLATWRLLDKNGFLDEGDLRELEGMGVGRGELYDVIAIVGLKTLSNYVNHIAKTEIDEPMRPYATREAP